MVSRWMVLLMLVGLTGCSGPATPSPTPVPRPVLVTSPALEPLVTAWLKGYAAASGPLAFDLAIRAPDAALASDETRIQGVPPVNASFTTPLGREAVVVIVHSDVSKRDFSLAELADVFSGRTSRWELLNGGTGPIQPVIPLPDDSLRLTFEEQVLASAPFASGARLAATPAMAAALVAETPGAIGLVPLSQPTDGVRTVRVNGQLADADRLDTGTYPLTFAVVATGSKVPAAPIYRFLFWRQQPAATAQP